MSQQRVRMVVFARYNISNFRAVYGRLSSEEESTYTKDFLQLPATASPDILAAMGAFDDRLNITYAWPGGEAIGYLKHSNDRFHLGWNHSAAPLPWKVGRIGDDPATSIEGRAIGTTPQEADAVFTRISGGDTRPWLIAVKLVDDDRLHTRVYFEKPPAGFEDRDLAQLPVDLQTAIRQLPTRTGVGAMRWEDSGRRAVRAPKVVTHVLEALKREPNVLLVGPPGTGKSVALEDLRHHYESGPESGAPLFDPDSWPGNWGRADAGDAPIGEARVEALVFHPAYGYENFVAGLFPVSRKEGGVKLVAKPGPLLSLSHWVQVDTSRRGLLILDEFNRGSAAAIFGDMLGLLDADKRVTPDQAGTTVARPYPNQSMPVPRQYRAVPDTRETIDRQVRLPAGLHIVAAMNSTDRSVAPLDAALRRRFSIIRVGPDYDVLQSHLLRGRPAPQSAPTHTDVAQWTTQDVAALAVNILRSLNERIEFCLGEDFLLGHALLWKVAGDTTDAALMALATAIDTKVVPTLRTTFIDQDDVLAAVLAASDTSEAGSSDRTTASVAVWRSAPGPLASISTKRLFIQLLADMAPTEQLKALTTLAGA